jgi:hypothetical protein
VPPTCDESYVTAGIEDGFWEVTTGVVTAFDNSANYIQVGFVITPPPVTSSYWHSFMVYRPAIPPASTILNARLILKAAANSPGAILESRVYAVLQPDPAVPINGIQCDTAPLTVNFTAWTLSNWINNLWYYSPDIGPVIQEIVNQIGYTSASKIIIQVRSSTPLSFSPVFYADSFDGNPLEAPILCVGWSVAREIYFKGMFRGEYRKMR